MRLPTTQCTNGGLHYRQWGDASRPCVLLLHGFLGCLEDWEVTVRAMGPGVRCVAVDLPGHGGSVRLADAALYSHRGLLAELNRLLDGESIASCFVAGYSMGARLALQWVTREPRRALGLIMESGSPGLRTIPERRARRAQDTKLARVLAGGCFEDFLTAWYRQPLFASLAGRPRLLARQMARRRRNDPAELARALAGLSVARQSNLWPRLCRLAVPTLVVTGDLDLKYTAIAAGMSSCNPLIRWQRVPCAGHNVHVERPAAYGAALRRFLAVRPGAESRH